MIQTRRTSLRALHRQSLRRSARIFNGVRDNQSAKKTNHLRNDREAESCATQDSFPKDTSAITSLTAETAAHLTLRYGDLSLDGRTTLSEEATEAFSHPRPQGRLYEPERAGCFLQRCRAATKD